MAQAPRRPDFFLIGAPKCGTTAMTDYLGQHPEIGMCARKEVHYFGGDLPYAPISEAAYLALFGGVGDVRRIGEASVWYLYSTEAAAEIKRFAPGARIIVMLRDPVEMLHSLHSQFVWNGKEPIEDFERALALDDDREQGQLGSAFTPSSYRAAARYASQVGRYFEEFGRERVHLIRFESFRAETLRCYHQTCAFLGVDSSFAPDLRVVNPNKQTRSRVLRHALRRPPPALRRGLRAFVPSRLRPRLRRSANRLNERVNTRYEPRGAMTPALRARLTAELSAEVRALERLAGEDLSAWLDASPAREASAISGSWIAGRRPCER